MKTTPNQRLKQFREKAGLRLEAIAAELDVSVSILQKVEAGGKELSDKMVDALNKRYQIPVNWLMKGDGELTYSLERENPYRDVLYRELKDQVDFLKETIRSLTGAKGNFRIPLNQTAQRRQLKYAS